MKEKTPYNEESALKESGKWQIMEWLWDVLPECPVVENVSDVDALGGTMTVTTTDGEEYTMTFNKGNWREL